MLGESATSVEVWLARSHPAPSTKAMADAKYELRRVVDAIAAGMPGGISDQSRKVVHDLIDQHAYKVTNPDQLREARANLMRLLSEMSLAAAARQQDFLSETSFFDAWHRLRGSLCPGFFPFC